MENFNLRLILASASPRRFELLSHLKIPFDVASVDIDEKSLEKSPPKVALDIAKQKGEALSSRILDDQIHQPVLIISADTLVSLGQKIYGKPKNRNEAGLFLMELSGKTHSVFTGVSGIFMWKGFVSRYSFVDESRVTFDHISETLLHKYLDTKDSLDKAGAYGIQGPSLTFISRVEGSYSNVVGFPLSRFIEETRSFFRLNFPENLEWQNMF
jgi:septum formation protein